jgi:hypothetical protein
LGFSTGAGSESEGLESRRGVGRKVEKAAAVVEGKRSVWDGATGRRRAWGPAALRINSCRADDLQAEQRVARSTDTGVIVLLTLMCRHPVEMVKLGFEKFETDCR